MPSDTPYRWALLAMFLGAMVVVVYHRWQAAATGEKISHREEGYGFAILLRLAGLALWLSVLTYLLWPDRLAWCQVSLPVPLRWVAIALGYAGIPLMYWTLRNLGKNITDTVVTRAAATLVTAGPYRWVRHPFYVTTAVLLVATTLGSANVLIGLLGAIVLGMLAIRTPREEAFLAERFGEDYRRYCRETGRFVPKWRHR